MMKKAMVHVGKALDRAAAIVAQHQGVILANYGQSVLVRVDESGLQGLLDAGYRLREVPERAVTRIAGFDLDTTSPSGLSTSADAARDALPSGRSHHIVRLAGPMHPDWRARMERMGAVLVQSVAEDLYLVGVDSARVDDLQALEFVEAVSPYYAAMKIGPGLLTAEVQAHLPAVDALSPAAADLPAPAPSPQAEGALRPLGAAAPPAADPAQVGNLEVALFEGEDPLPAVDGVRALGGKVIRIAGSRLIVYAEMATVPAIAALPQVRELNPYRPPRLNNNVATGILRADTLHNDLGLDGTGQVVAIADTGLDSGVDDATMHDDFEGRIVAIHALGRPGDASDIHNHGTHVAGSVLGNGATSLGQIQGMAPAAQAVFQSTMDAARTLSGLPGDLRVGLFDVARDDGAHIHTNSWSNSPTDGAYQVEASQTDDFCFRNRGFLVLFSAGNDAPTRVNSPGTAKNVLTVGASESVRPLPASVDFPASPAFPGGATLNNVSQAADNQNQVAGFSCPGPTQTNRRKPDIVAPGTWILSTRSSVSTYDCGPDGIGADEFPPAGTGDEDGVWTHAEAVASGLPGQPIMFAGDQNTPAAPPGSGPAATANYCYMSGTSMSTPITAGACALLRQYLVEQRGHTPSAALLKALMVNGAVDMGMGIPNNNQGWGRVDLANALLPPGTGRVQFDDSLDSGVATGDVRTYDVWVSDPAPPLAVTLVWRDPAGAALQNRLHLRVIDVASGTETVADPIANIRNNVQKVVIPAPAVGPYRIEVEGVNVATGVPELPGLRQDYALVVAGAIGFSCNPSDVVQIIDRSGSMGAEGYMEPAKERAKQMIDILQINDRAGVVTFAASAVEEMALTLVDSQEVKDDAHALINPVASAGLTDLREALEQGLTTLGADAGRPRAVVFLSDGKHTVATPEIDDPFLDAIAAANVRVYTIALGPDSDFAVLNNIAARTGTGAVYTVESAADLHKLHEIYYDIIGGLGCGGVAHLASTALMPGAQLVEWAEIDGSAKEGFFAASWPRADAEMLLQLKSPTGKLYSPETGGALYYRGSTHAYYRLSRPEPGQWTILVRHQGGGGNAAQVVTTAAMADGEVACKVELDPKYLYVDQVLLRLSAQYGGAPLSGGRATARITFPTQSVEALLKQYAAELKEVKLTPEQLSGDKGDDQLLRLGLLAAQFGAAAKDLFARETLEIELRDDGKEEDPKADDGVYTAFFDPKKAGVAGNYQIQVFFTVDHDKLGRHTCTRLIPVYAPRIQPEPKLVIGEVLVRRNKLWRYTILGARVAHEDGTPATPADGVSVTMTLTQGGHKVRSGSLPYYRQGRYYIWRLDRSQAGLQPGPATVTVQAYLGGMLAAQAGQVVQL